MLHCWRLVPSASPPPPLFLSHPCTLMGGGRGARISLCSGFTPCFAQGRCLPAARGAPGRRRRGIIGVRAVRPASGAGRKCGRGGRLSRAPTFGPGPFHPQADQPRRSLVTHFFTCCRGKAAQSSPPPSPPLFSARALEPPKARIAASTARRSHRSRSHEVRVDADRGGCRHYPGRRGSGLGLLLQLAGGAQERRQLVRVGARGGGQRRLLHGAICTAALDRLRLAVRRGVCEEGRGGVKAAAARFLALKSPNARRRRPPPPHLPALACDCRELATSSGRSARPRQSGGDGDGSPGDPQTATLA
eukprot:366369-Chlamydomonas_euryale.AAC.1